MGTIVIYSSNTGFTEQYALELSERLSCPCVSLKKLGKAELGAYDRIIFGGWVMGNAIMGLDKLRDIATPDAVFAVGCTPPFEEVVASIREQNKLADTPLFYLEGGLRLDKLGLPQRMILKAVKKSTAKKSDRDRQGDFMVEMLGTSFDHSDKAQLEPLAEYAGTWN
ncbi:flavodoxin domain-containing protein [Adlercreutzia sp. ZJ473]|uniref:flavodoxin domain-containing protein n=1 Tax=Adlercreutzia sp. ZJ473 TaxID=2722822 RepID=UPI00155803E9|nr:flavodoxin domain-containing protein [Adlercreutzia sp. ZJ473]